MVNASCASYYRIVYVFIYDDNNDNDSDLYSANAKCVSRHNFQKHGMCSL